MQALDQAILEELAGFEAVGADATMSILDMVKVLVAGATPGLQEALAAAGRGEGSIARQAEAGLEAMPIARQFCAVFFAS